MSLLKFGQYFGYVPDSTIGADLGLDGIDGFDDQTLWYYQKGDRLTFIINPDDQEHILRHTMVEVEILKDTGANDKAETKIIGVAQVGVFFHRKPITYENDFLELVDYYSLIWSATFAGKQQYPTIGYKEFESTFLKFSELDEVISTGSCSTTRKVNDNTRIYAELLSDGKTIRVIAVGGNVPDNCFLYDISDIDNYRNVLLAKSSTATWSDEKDWRAEIVK